MKKRFFSLALCLALALGVAAIGDRQPPTPPKVQHSIERLYSHRIAYLKDHEREGYCTGTAVGPHALMTALHCDRGQIDTISLDLSVSEYHILGYASDGRDHIIYLLDGPAFTKFVKVRPAKKISNGDHVFFYGDPQGGYPSLRRDGTVVSDVLDGDWSEIDLAAGTHSFSFESIPGDSGSAIYNDAGEIVGLVTYSRQYYDLKYATGFELNFPQETLDAVAQ